MQIYGPPLDVQELLFTGNFAKLYSKPRRPDFKRSLAMAGSSASPSRETNRPSTRPVPPRRATDRDVGDLGDRLHLLDVANADLRDPEGAADVRPLVAEAGALHGAACAARASHVTHHPSQRHTVPGQGTA